MLTLVLSSLRMGAVATNGYDQKKDTRCLSLLWTSLCSPESSGNSVQITDKDVTGLSRSFYIFQIGQDTRGKSHS